MKKLLFQTLFFVFGVWLSTPAFAVKVTKATSSGSAIQSQYFFQSEAGQNQIFTQAMFATNTIKRAPPSSNNTSNLTALRLRYERGLNEMFTVSGEIGAPFNTQINGGNSYTLKGLFDLLFQVRGRKSLSNNMNLYFGGVINHSLGKNEWTLNNSNELTSINVQSGGTGFSPYVGFSYSLRPITLGARLSTEIDLIERKSTVIVGSTTLNSEDRGRNETKLATFAERAIDSDIIGIELYYSSRNTQKMTYSDGSTGTIDGDHNIGLSVYNFYYFNSDTALLTMFEYIKGVALKTGTTSDNTWGVVIGGRFLF